MKIAKLWAGIAIAALFVPANMAMASTITVLPATQVSTVETYDLTLGSGGLISASQSTIGTFSVSTLQSDPDGSWSGSAFASVEMVPNPTIKATATNNIISGKAECCSPTASVNYNYWADVVGPKNANVPVDLLYTDTVTLTGPSAVGNAIAQGGLGVFASPEVPNIDHAYFLGTESVSGSIYYLSTANAPFSVEGWVQAVVEGYTGSATITLDPILNIDPSFAAVDPNYRQDYSIVLSPGVGNAASAAPEPATWATILLGIGALGTAMRGRGRDLRRFKFADVKVDDAPQNRYYSGAKTYHLLQLRILFSNY